MAFAYALTPPSIFLVPTRPLSAITRRFPAPTFTGGGRCMSVVAKAVGDNSDTSDGSIVKSFQDAWSSSENLIGVAGLGFAAIVAVWASSHLIEAIDKLPLVPTVFEFIGLLFTWWFIYRYLVFRPDREEFSKIVKDAVSSVLGK
ncbi:protein CURVATURE THYLAKOID 1C, chloroplastic [Curcuma longa]|uniref:protein CURVATURE THYLAKOID 1C, chloroplastic n=1 Tax=Curcuma longa TaxID=136217 RepID=UPI003D9F674A